MRVVDGLTGFDSVDLGDERSTGCSCRRLGGKIKIKVTYGEFVANGEGSQSNNYAKKDNQSGMTFACISQQVYIKSGWQVQRKFLLTGTSPPSSQSHS